MFFVSAQNNKFSKLETNTANIATTSLKDDC